MKIFKVADLRKLESQVVKGEISYSRKVEILNDMANKKKEEYSTEIKGVEYFIEKPVFDLIHSISLERDELKEFKDEVEDAEYEDFYKAER